MPIAASSRALLAAAVLLAAACHRGDNAGAPSPQLQFEQARAAMLHDITYLASDELEGRGTGTAGNDSAAAFIARHYVALGLEPILPNADERCAGTPVRSCPAALLQPFTASPAFASRGGMERELATNNVLALLRGSDPHLNDEYVVIGAHFDHLGRSTFGALDPQDRNAIRNGADDNASGTAAVMELARRLARNPPRRSVLFANFSAEELGLLGSQHMVARFPVPLESVQAMLNFDMVGRMRGDSLIVYGTATAAGMDSIVILANEEHGLTLRRVGDGFGPSDHASFYARGIPVLHFFTDLHADYHRASDDVERINADGLVRVVNYAERVLRDLANHPERLRHVSQPMPVARAAGRSGASLGTIPDMAAGDTEGVRLTGVREGSPAAAAGIRAGDVLVEFAGRTIRDLYDFTDALAAQRPGDVVEIVVLRGGERVTVKATLAARGS